MKPKFFVGALVLALAFTASAAGSLKIGMKGDAVKALQTSLNACGATISTDGSFGRGTKAAVMAFQTSKSLKADGIAGMMTMDALKNCGTTTTTGTTTGTTTTTTTTTTTGASSVEGYVADIASDSSNRVSTVYESEMNKVAAGVRLTARLSPQKVESVKVTFKNTNSASSANLAKYATSVSLMKDSTVLKTMTVAEADRSNTDDTYTFQFTGLGSEIAKDTIGRFYVAVNGTGSIDSTDSTNASWDVKFIDVRTVSPNGVYIVNSSSPFPVTQTGLKFGKYTTSGVKVTLGTASSNPVAMTKEVSETVETKEVKLLDFTVKADLTDVKLRNLPINILAKTAAGAAIADQTTIINTVKLMKGTEMIDNLSATANGVYTFSNLSTTGATVKAGTTDTYSIVVDVKRQMNGLVAAYASGSSLTANVANITNAPLTGQTVNGIAGLTIAAFSVQDVNGDQLTSRSGSATGNIISLSAKGVLLAKGTSSVASSGGNTPTGIWKINVKVSAIGDTMYVADAALATLADLKDGSGAAAASPSITIAPASGTTISKDGSFYRINAGETKDFVVTVTKATTAGTQYRASLNTFTYKVGNTAAADSTYTADLVNFNTEFFAI